MTVIPDVTKMTAEQFVMWGFAALLGFLLYAIPAAITDKLRDQDMVHAKIREEHKTLLMSTQIQCYNHADNVPDEETRAKHHRRCLTLQLNGE